MTLEKTIVALMIYNRFENLQRWIDCWKQCEKENAELVVIHNQDDPISAEKYKSLCKENRIKYIKRPNRGFDIGAFQDICRQRLEGFNNEWDYLLWVSDDTIPMKKDFVSTFVKLASRRNTGVSCMHISREVTLHIRTTGFCIKKEIANKLTFPHDPVLTKDHCYYFEHRGGTRTFYRQLLAMRLTPVQVAPIETSPLWDIGHPRFLRMGRHQEHYSVFGDKHRIKSNGDKVTFICPIYNSFPEIISSLICQTHKEWELLLIHDGPNRTGLKKYVNSIGDPRIKYSETSIRNGAWGHKIRRDTLESLKDRDTDFVVITNPDNYHIPTYIEYYLKGFKSNPDAIAAYCSKMVHSYRAWDSQECRLERGWLDCGGVMVRKEAACRVGWNNIIDHSADWVYFEDLIKKYGTKSFIKIPGCLFVHN